jgi:hypothetical protein
MVVKMWIFFSGLLCRVVLYMVTNLSKEHTSSISNPDSGALPLTSNVYFYGRTYLDFPFSQAATHMIFIAMSTGM